MSELNTEFYGYSMYDKKEFETVKAIIEAAHEEGQTCFCCDIEDKHSYWLLFEADCGNKKECEHSDGEICDRYYSDEDYEWCECPIMVKQCEKLEKVIDKINEKFNVDDMFVSEYVPNGVYVRFEGWDE